MKATVKSAVSGAFFCCMAVFTALAPLFSLLSMEDMYGRSSVGENGFDLVSMKSPIFFAGNEDEIIRFLIGALGVFSIVLAVFGTVMAVFGAVGIFNGKLRAAWRGLGIAALVLLSLYALGGLLYLFTYIDTNAGPYIRMVRTFCHLPVLFGFVCFFFYRLAERAVPEKGEMHIVSESKK